MWKLSFISEDDFSKHVKATIEKYGEKLESFDLKRFNKNIIDPIKLIFDKTVYQSSWDEIVSNEIFRQRDKSNNNDIANWFINNYDALYLTTICSKMFHREIIKSNLLQFDLFLKRGEDTIFVYNYISCCKNIKLNPIVIYKYYFEATAIEQKYSLNANECIDHIHARIASTKNIEQAFSIKLTATQKDTYTTYLHLFYTHLKSANKIERITELKKFRENSNKLQLWRALNFKDYIYWRIMPMFPS